MLHHSYLSSFKANLAVQEARLGSAMADLNGAQARLDEKQRELDLVMAEYEKAMQHMQMLKDDAERCRKKMDTAAALISGLTGERERWTSQSKEFKEQIVRWVVWVDGFNIVSYHCIAPVHIVRLLNGIIRSTTLHSCYNTVVYRTNSAIICRIWTLTDYTSCVLDPHYNTVLLCQWFPTTPKISVIMKFLCIHLKQEIKAF